jgi:hypothetical protein
MGLIPTDGNSTCSRPGGAPLAQEHLDDLFVLDWRLPRRPRRLDLQEQARVVLWLLDIERTCARDPEFAAVVQGILARIAQEGDAA